MNIPMHVCMHAHMCVSLSKSRAQETNPETLRNGMVEGKSNEPGVRSSAINSLGDPGLDFFICDTETAVPALVEPHSHYKD